MKRTSKQQQKLTGRGGADQPVVVGGHNPAANIHNARVGGVNAEHSAHGREVADDGEGRK